jgi:hypothetical protein
VRTRMPAGHLSVRPRCAKLCARVSSLAVGRNMGPGERRACGRITSSSARALPAARSPTGIVKLNNRSASQIYVWVHDNLFPGCNRSWCPKHKLTRPISQIVKIPTSPCQWARENSTWLVGWRYFGNHPIATKSPRLARSRPARARR